MHVADVIGSMLGSDLPIRVLGYDGSKAGPDTAETALRIASPRALARLATAPGSLGLARAYVDRASWRSRATSTPCSTGSRTSRCTTCRAPSSCGWPAGSRRSRCATACGRPGPGVPTAGPAALARSATARSIAHHYDVSNTFYEWVLGPSMAYTCAVYPTADATLEQAQAAKFELVAQKLALKPGMRLLDVGCGWGAMVMHAAAEHGVRALGVTLSRNQAQWAQAEIERRGLARPRRGPAPRLPRHARRAVRRRQLDRAHRAPRPRRRCRRTSGSWRAGCARAGGCSTTASPRAARRATCRTDPFIARYVFPDGQLHAVGHLACR